MPTTRPRKLRIGGVELSVTLDRMLAERVKAMPLYQRLTGAPPPMPFIGEEPLLNGQKVGDIDWYHTLDLGNGVVTPGYVDHRDQVDLYGLPASLAGKRCLDVATFDGFWAYEMEKRGAAEVIGIDVHTLADSDFPTNFRPEYLRNQKNDVKGLGFAYARRALGSRVKRKVLSVYELSPDVIGTFDFVFMSDLMLHLRDPLKALEAVRTVTRGEAIFADAYDKQLEAANQPGATRFTVALDGFSGCTWWSPSTTALEAMIYIARFTEVQKVAQLDLDTKDGLVVPKVVFKARGGPLPSA